MLRSPPVLHVVMLQNWDLTIEQFPKKFPRAAFAENMFRIFEDNDNTTELLLHS